MATPSNQQPPETEAGLIPHVQRVGATEKHRMPNRRSSSTRPSSAMLSQEREELEMRLVAARPCRETPMERFLTIDCSEEPNPIYCRHVMAYEPALRCVQGGDLSTLALRQQAAKKLLSDIPSTGALKGTSEQVFDNTSDSHQIDGNRAN